MLGLAAYPILGPSDYPSRVIFVYIIAEFERKSNFFFWIQIIVYAMLKLAQKYTILYS